MPFNSFKSFGSVEGYRTFHKKVLTTYTFPSGTSTFTVPNNVTSLTSLVAKGQDGSSDYVGGYGWLGPGWSVASKSANGSYGTVDWSTIYNLVASQAGNGGVRDINIYYDDWAIGPNNQSYYNGPYGGYSSYPVTVTGQVDIIPTLLGATHQAGAATSGTVLYSQLTASENGWSLAGTPYNYGSAGSNTTGFGYTFNGGGYSGGTGYSATTTTYNDVAVTPNTTYTVVNNGSFVITYYT
jgi:hypothetical protein